MSSLMTYVARKASPGGKAVGQRGVHRLLLMCLVIHLYYRLECL